MLEFRVRSFRTLDLEEGPMLLARVVRVNLEHFFQDLREGDLVVWGIVIGVVFFTGLSIYQKLRAFAPRKSTEST
jgi:hypothetical protein